MSSRLPGRDRADAPVHVLVVDDSAVVRQAFTAILGGGAGFTVAVAPDPLIAFDKIRQARPQVIVLDLEMPRMDGLTFLRRIMAEDPIPVVVCSGLAERGTEAALQALAEGAVEVVGKPRLGVRDFLHESASALVDAVRGAALARVRPRVAEERKLTADAVLPRREAPRLTMTSDKVVAVGASTGGTEALRRILEALPLDAPGVVVVQHMPALFTRAFAERLDRSCRIEVKEAASGDRVLEGRALVAPGNRHLLLQRSGAHYTVEVNDGPPVSRHRPSVDVLFRSAAQAAGPNAIGIIMTGMGADGAAGLLEMKRAGAVTVAQDEASCVVFGMPREAIARGAVDATLPLDRIPEAILRFATSAATAHAAR